MMAYPSGYKPDHWSPKPEERTYRFSLGNTSRASPSDPPFIAICMNPSYADSSESDRTVNRIIQASIDNAQAGWVMLNLYPERATDAANLLDYNAALSAANCDEIERVLGQYGVSEVFVAWGRLKHVTLRLAKIDVLNTLDRLGTRPFMFDGLTADGDPLHPTPRGPALLMQGPKRYLFRVGNRFVEQVP